MKTPMADFSSEPAPKTEKPLVDLITEAGQRAAAKVRDRNRRMGWPLIVDPLPEESIIPSVVSKDAATYETE